MKKVFYLENLDNSTLVDELIKIKSSIKQNDENIPNWNQIKEDTDILDVFLDLNQQLKNEEKIELNLKLEKMETINIIQENNICKILGFN